MDRKYIYDIIFENGKPVLTCTYIHYGRVMNDPYDSPKFILDTDDIRGSITRNLRTFWKDLNIRDHKIQDEEFIVFRKNASFETRLVALYEYRFEQNEFLL